jgi:hypothetical protein
MIVAVTSRGDQFCEQAGIDTRVDAYLSFISSFMTAHGDAPSCGADGRCGFNCTTPDPDCPCATDGLCTTACPNVLLDTDCPAQCAHDGVCKRTGCPAPDPDCVQDQQLCNANSICQSAHCAIPPGSSQRICMELCDQGQTCPSNTHCALDNSNKLACVPGAGPATTGTTATASSSSTGTDSTGSTGTDSTGSTGTDSTGTTGTDSTGTTGTDSTGTTGTDSTGSTDSGSTGAATTGTTGADTAAASTTGSGSTGTAGGATKGGCAASGDGLGLLALAAASSLRRRWAQKG